MSVNKVILVGYVGADPEVRYLDKGSCVARLRLATTERAYTAANGTTVPERTEWHSVVLWRGLAEIAEKYIRKGTQLYIEGKLRTSQWNDQNGVAHQRTEIVADSLELLGTRRNDNNMQA
ncbi:MAG: single-stranded DNA-binding protein [Bacteroidaceae bacterium]|nr:single-stranded DNA-binding protein [Bacteroidaceae bacterium]MBQ2978878.1 single-stranded DNA-binding protein [Bacteroidaceae bacterium]